MDENPVHAQRQWISTARLRMSYAAIGSGVTSSYQAYSRKYRVAQCHFYERGVCSKGRHCTFLHSDFRERLVPIGAPPGSSSIFRAPRPRRPLCRYFERDACKLGEDCSFSHDSSNKSSSSDARVKTDALPRPIGWNFKTLPCKFYPLGKCRKGNDCTYVHINDKSSGRLDHDDSGKKSAQARATNAASADFATDVPTSSSGTSSDDSDDGRSDSSTRGSVGSRLDSRCIDASAIDEASSSASSAFVALRAASETLPPRRRQAVATAVPEDDPNLSQLQSVKVMVWREQRWETEVWDLEAMARDISFET